jgi:hypothetical protein
MPDTIARPPLDLIPGDCLLYRPSGVFGCIVSFKTWTDLAHVEVYVGGGLSVASRGVTGVNKYPLRVSKLAYVLRPTLQPVDIEAGLAWFEKSARGQKYDLWGQLLFFQAVKRGNNGRMFCSEFATRFYRNCGVPCFAPHWDADRVPPAMFYASPALMVAWDDGKPIA